MMTKEEIFRGVADHLLAQGSKSMGYITDSNGTPTRSCRYRGDNGRMCAVGFLIRDHYDEKAEGIGMAALLPGEKGWLSRRYGTGERSSGSPVLAACLNSAGVPSDQEVYQMLSALQRLHDLTDPSTWEDELCQLAAKFSVDWRPVR